MSYRVKKAVAFVVGDNVLEIFNTNNREAVRIEIDAGALDVIMKFDGTKSVDEVLADSPGVNKEELIELLRYLNQKKAVIYQDCTYLPSLVEERPRTISFLEDYSESTSEVVLKLKMLEEKRVMIIGLGAVGTWVAESLVRAGVKSLTLMDNDVVEPSNIHRQGLFFESDAGKYKVDCAKRYLEDIADIDCSVVKEELCHGVLEEVAKESDLIINCADHPSVDVTTDIVGKFCMPRNMPHIVGGGYNLHLTLIGQAVIPGITACVKCFEKTLGEINSADLDGVRKLERTDRKIGSFGPLTKISASISSLEAIKILIESYESLVSADKRIEFRLDELDFSVKEIGRRDDCDWCGDGREKVQ